MMEQLTLSPISTVSGTVNVPGSKSSNRALLIAALAKGTTTLTNLLDSDDIRYARALEQLVFNIVYHKITLCKIDGLGGNTITSR